LRAVGTLRAQRQPVLAGWTGGAGQHAVGDPDHLRRRAVVALEADDGGAGAVLGEVEEVGRRGAGEGVNGLARVTDHAEVLAVAEPEVEQALLQRADVLVLVDDEVAVLAADGIGDLRGVGQQRDVAQQHVFHVDEAAVAAHFFVGREHAGDGRGVVAGQLAAGSGGDGGIVVGADVADLGPLDLARQVTTAGEVGLHPAPVGGLGDVTQLALDDLGQLGAVDLGPEEARLAQRGGVERAGRDAADAELAQSCPHLAGRAGGERDGQHLLWLPGAGVDAVSDPVRDRTGLSGARTGEDAQRAT
jgi:hypothetical protein